MSEDTYSYTAFADMMEDHERMDARVSAEIGDHIVEGHLLARCFEASHLLAPPDAWTLRLSDVQPVYAATFEIANPAGIAGDFILDVELSQDGGVTNLISKRWLQLRKDKTEPRNLLDGSIVSLQNGLAWHIGLDAFVPVDEQALSPNYLMFPHTLTLDVSNLEEGHNFINYRTRVPVKSVRQKRCWKFNTVASKGEWVVEVSQVMKTVQQNGSQKPFEPRWTLNVHNNNWDRLLAANNGLDIGKVASWGVGNPCNLLFPENPDSSALTGVSRQVGDGTDSESDGDGDSEENQEEPDGGPEEPPSLKNFEQLLDLLRQLAGIAAGRTNSALH
ncbi:dna polymerase v family and armadillo-type fold domain-containing protein [Neofusicoccum parvum]|uniref:Dna polymerase v family and armadillo-type fold domain-containing protein n=1 Tax=Neofusicoccum parvum TaxID=310453 RepID=A0ACB5RWP5_9PEZI|nr:dna polymerase v family and armadillo-type fold domain-containing protein [Neofusicoccum parvum]